MNADESQTGESRDKIDALDTSEGLYGLMAEFADAQRAAARRRGRARRGLSAHGRLFAAPGRRFVRGARLPPHAAAAVGAHRGNHRGTDWLRLPVLGLGYPLPVEHWWPAVSQLAGVYPGHVRNDDPRRVVYCGPGDARTQRSSHAVSSSLQFARVQPGVAGSVFPVHRSTRSRGSTSNNDIRSFCDARRRGKGNTGRMVNAEA